MPDEIFFSEKQRFKQWWLWLLIIVINAVAIWKAVRSFHENDAAAGNTGVIVSIVVSLLLLALFLLFRLDTQIRHSGIYVRFFPLHAKYKFYSWSTISRLYVRKYAPLKEFGGWGVRYGSNGKAYNISGNDGLQIELANGKQLLIGTGKPEELSAILLQLTQLVHVTK